MFGCKSTNCSQHTNRPYQDLCHFLIRCILFRDHRAIRWQTRPQWAAANPVFQPPPPLPKKQQRSRRTHPADLLGRSRWSWSACRWCPRTRCSPASGPGARCSSCGRTACPPGSAACSWRWPAPCARSCRPRCVRRARRLQCWAEG